MSNAPDAGPPIVDYKGALHRLGGDRKLFNDMAQFYWEDSPTLLETIRKGVSDRNALEIERASHGLKGLSSNFGAPDLVKCAFEIEQLAHAGDIGKIAEKLDRLEQEVSRLTVALRQYCPPAS